jgi:copper homeostasis protein
MTARGITLEICLDSVESALAARDGGAHRIELCAAMPDGGITPSFGLIRSVRRAVRTRLHVLIRPRPGDFRYSPAELRAMSDDILAAKELGADGVVLGVLTAHRDVDVRAISRLVRAARPMSVTFHRAFDDVRDRAGALDTLIDQGVDRVLTSGGASTAFGGRKEIGRLVARSAGRIAVMAGGGVGPPTVARLLAETGIGEVHAGSAVSTARTSGRSVYRSGIAVVEAGKVKSFLKLLRESS